LLTFETAPFICERTVYSIHDARSEKHQVNPYEVLDHQLSDSCRDFVRDLRHVLSCAYW